MCGGVAVLLLLGDLTPPAGEAPTGRRDATGSAPAREAGDRGARPPPAPRLHAAGDVVDAADVARLRGVALHADASSAARALRTLSRQGRVSGDPRLVGLLHDPRPPVRDQAILALGASRDERSVDDLTPLLVSTDVKARWLAIHALGDLGGTRAETLVAQALADAAQAPERTSGQDAGRVTPPPALEPYEDR